MGHLAIHCDSCGSDWVVYHRDDWKHWKARTCPTCGKEIDPGTWNRHVIRAFGEMEDTNLELMKDHTALHGALFTISYVPDTVFPNKSDDMDQIRQEIELLTDRIEELTEITSLSVDKIFQV